MPPILSTLIESVLSNGEVMTTPSALRSWFDEGEDSDAVLAAVAQAFDAAGLVTLPPLPQAADGKIMRITTRDHTERSKAPMTLADLPSYFWPAPAVTPINGLLQTQSAGRGLSVVSWNERGVVSLVELSEPASYELFRADTGLVVGLLELQSRDLCVWGGGSGIQLLRYDSGMEVALDGQAGVITQVIELSDATIVAAANDGSLVRWDPIRSARLNDFIVQQGVIRDLQALPDDRFVSLGDYGTLCIWHTSSVKALSTIDCGAAMSHCRVLDADTVLGWGPGELGLWSVESGRVISRLTHSAIGTRKHSVRETSRGILFGGTDGLVRVWNPKSSTIELEIETDVGNDIRGVRLVRDDYCVVFGSSGYVHVLHLQHDAPRLALAHGGVINDVIVLTDGNVVSCGNDGTIRHWDSHTGQKLCSIGGPPASDVDDEVGYDDAVEGDDDDDLEVDDDEDGVELDVDEMEYPAAWISSTGQYRDVEGIEFRVVRDIDEIYPSSFGLTSAETVRIAQRIRHHRVIPQLTFLPGFGDMRGTWWFHPLIVINECIGSWVGADKNGIHFAGSDDDEKPQGLSFGSIVSHGLVQREDQLWRLELDCADGSYVTLDEFVRPGLGSHLQMLAAIIDVYLPVVQASHGFSRWFHGAGHETYPAFGSWVDLHNNEQIWWHPERPDPRAFGMPMNAPLPARIHPDSYAEGERANFRSGDMLVDILQIAGAWPKDKDPMGLDPDTTSNAETQAAARLLVESIASSHRLFVVGSLVAPYCTVVDAPERGGIRSIDQLSQWPGLDDLDWHEHALLWYSSSVSVNNREPAPVFFTTQGWIAPDPTDLTRYCLTRWDDELVYRWPAGNDDAQYLEIGNAKFRQSIQSQPFWSALSMLLADNVLRRLKLGEYVLGKSRFRSRPRLLQLSPSRIRELVAGRSY